LSNNNKQEPPSSSNTCHVETTKRHDDDDDDGPFAIRSNKGQSVILATGTHWAFWAFWAICTLIRASSIYTLSGGIRSTTTMPGDLGERDEKLRPQSTVPNHELTADYLQSFRLHTKSSPVITVRGCCAKCVIANRVEPWVTKSCCGVCRKFGEGIRLLTTGIGVAVYAIYSSLKVTFVVFAVVSVVSVSALLVRVAAYDALKQSIADRGPFGNDLPSSMHPDHHAPGNWRHCCGVNHKQKQSMIRTGDAAVNDDSSCLSTGNHRSLFNEATLAAATLLACCQSTQQSTGCG
jgi:hypothetical protein